MEKLIELLNEYNKELHWVDRAYKDGFDLGYEQEYMRDFRVAYLISKSFWFIKRLVDNDKIDLDKLEKIWYEETVYEWDWQYRKIVEYSDCESLLMLLAISENPIEDLISYLK